MARPRGIRKPEIAELICDRIASGYTLRQIGREIGCAPCAITAWRRQDTWFATMYDEARQDQAEYLAEQLREIADDGTNDWQQREMASGAIELVPDHEHIQRHRLRVDTRKWLMSKQLPKKYGDKLALTTPDGPNFEAMSDDERITWATQLAARMRRLLANADNGPRSGRRERGSATR